MQNKQSTDSKDKKVECVFTWFGPRSGGETTHFANKRTKRATTSYEIEGGMHVFKMINLFFFVNEEKNSIKRLDLIFS